MHANCEHERLRFDEDRSGMPVWALIAIPAGVAAIAAALLLLRSRMKAPGTETTRGSEPLARESERHSVPPPIARQL